MTFTVAVVGSGVAACAFVRTLSRRWTAEISRTSAVVSPLRIVVYEMGRGPSGRLATRISRGDSTAFDHGTPAFHLVKDATTCNVSKRSLFSSFMYQAIEEGALEKWDCSFATVNAMDGSIEKVSASSQPEMLRGVPQMSNVCQYLLHRARNKNVVIELKFRDLIERTCWDETTRTWFLRRRGSKKQEKHNALVITSALLGHKKRWNALFSKDSEAPLYEPARGDQDLSFALDEISVQQTRPVIVTMCTADAIVENLKCDMYHIENHDVLRKVVVDKQARTIVLHSTHEFAMKNEKLTAEKSSISKFIGSGDIADEHAVANIMLKSIKDVFALPDECMNVRGVCTHRWGAAFPSTEGVSQTVFPSKNLFFAGDFSLECKSSNFVQLAGQSGCDAADAMFESIIHKAKGVI